MKEITKTRWKKFGYFCLSFVPMLTYLAIAMIVSVGISVLIAVMGILQRKADLYDYIIEETMNQSMLAGTIYAVLGIIALGLWYFFGCKRKNLKPPKGVVTPVNLVLLAALGYCMQYVTSYLMVIMGALLPKALESYVELMDMAGVGEVTVLGILYGVILGPVAEELTFRGMTLYFAEKFTKRFWLANIFQAVLFGLFHGNLIQGVYAFALGLIMGWIYKQFHSLYASIWFHIFFNFLAFGPLEFLDGLLPQNVVFRLGWGALMYGLAIGCIALIWKRTRRESR